MDQLSEGKSLLVGSDGRDGVLIANASFASLHKFSSPHAFRLVPAVARGQFFPVYCPPVLLCTGMYNMLLEAVPIAQLQQTFLPPQVLCTASRVC